MISIVIGRKQVISTMWGQAVVMLAVLVFVLFLALFSQTHEEPSNAIFTDVHVNNQKLKTPSKSLPTKRNVGSRSQSQGKFQGQFGVKIRIIRDYLAVPVPTAKQPEIYALDATSFLIDEEISISDFDSGSYGAYVPDDGDYLYMIEPAVEPVNRPCNVFEKVDPKYPIVAIDAQKEGEVVVIIPLDADGNKTVFPIGIAQEFEADGYRVYLRKYKVYGYQKRIFNVAVVYEEPTDWFFASNLLKAVSQWKFTPTIENGMAVASYISIRCYYCLGNNCLPFEYDIIRAAK
jgi:hypothetical protein